MPTRICVTYGELITDTSIQRANPLPPGVYIGGAPSVSPAGGGAFSVSIAPAPDRGVTAYRTVPQTPYHGSATIYEDGNLVFTIQPPSAQPRIDLLVAAHKWVQGPIDAGTGQPTGAVTPEMMPVYSVVVGTASSNPVPPSIPTPFDVDGRCALALAQVLISPDGTCIARRLNDMRLERFPRLGANGLLDPAQLPWGASVVATFQTIAAMQAVPASDRYEKQTALVVGLGLYSYSASETAAPSGQDIVSPDDAQGRWVRTLAPGGSNIGNDGVGGALYLHQNFR